MNHRRRSRRSPAERMWAKLRYSRVVFFASVAVALAALLRHWPVALWAAFGLMLLAIAMWFEAEGWLARDSLDQPRRQRAQP